MQVENYMQLGLPVLEAQLSIIKTVLNKIYTVTRGAKKISAKVTLNVETILAGAPLCETFNFPTTDTIPGELNQFLSDWSKRLIAEQWIIEEAISQLQGEKAA